LNNEDIKAAAITRFILPKISLYRLAFWSSRSSSQPRCMNANGATLKASRFKFKLSFYIPRNSCRMFFVCIQVCNDARARARTATWKFSGYLKRRGARGKREGAKARCDLHATYGRRVG